MGEAISGVGANQNRDIASLIPAKLGICGSHFRYAWIVANRADTVSECSGT